MIRRVPALLGSSTARNAVGSSANQGIVLVMGILTFYVLGTRLGVAGYGAYVAALALVYLVAPLAEVGCNHLAVRTLARDQDLARAWHLVLGAHLVSAPLAAALLGLLAGVLAPTVGAWPLALLAVGELLAMGVTAGAGMLAEGARRAFVGARFRMVTSALRVAGLGWFALWGSGLRSWILVATLTNLAGFAYVVVGFGRAFEVGPGFRVVGRGDAREGMSYGANHLAATAQRDSDKAILGAYGLDAAAGTYAAGFRAISIVTLPMLGLVGATYGRFFELGARSVRGARDYALRLTLASSAVTAPMGVGLFLAAPIVPVVFGEGYRDSVEVIRWLAVYPLLKALQVFAANALTGAALHRLRVAAIAVTAVGNVAANLLVIPRYSWRGAIATTLAAEVVLAALLWAVLQRATRAEGAARPVADPATVGASDRAG